MFLKKIYILVLCLFVFGNLNAKTYKLTNDPIDVIIPSTDKDLLTLDLCIEGIRNNCNQVRRIIVVSDRPLTTKAEWFDEKNFPFTKEEAAYYLTQCNDTKTKEFLSAPNSRVGWYFQQLIKLYASYVIPDISPNVLHLDSDTIFLNPTNFMDAQGNGLYNPAPENHAPYFAHTSRLIPGLGRLFPEYSGITHHMLLQRDILDDIFQTVEENCKMELWEAYCFHVDPEHLYYSGAASDELYFNFAFTNTKQTKLRFLKWENVSSLKALSKYKRRGYNFVSCHSWSRE